MKDIFIDNNIAKNFAKADDPEYKKLIKWLLKYDINNPTNNAVLDVSNKLIGEYGRTCSNSYSETSIWVIVDVMTKQGRLNKITNEAIKEFIKRYFKKKVVRHLTCNEEDREFIPVILLSFRKYALVRDHAFACDLRSFPGFTVLVEHRPQDLPYEK